MNFQMEFTILYLFVYKAEHLMRLGRTSNALESLNKALELNQGREPYRDKEEHMMVVSTFL
jgi:hypothetical protein